MKLQWILVTSIVNKGYVWIVKMYNNKYRCKLELYSSSEQFTVKLQYSLEWFLKAYFRNRSTISNHWYQTCKLPQFPWNVGTWFCKYIAFRNQCWMVFLYFNTLSSPLPLTIDCCWCSISQKENIDVTISDISQSTCLLT